MVPPDRTTARQVVGTLMERSCTPFPALAVAPAHPHGVRPPAPPCLALPRLPSTEVGSNAGHCPCRRQGISSIEQPVPPDPEQCLAALPSFNSATSTAWGGLGILFQNIAMTLGWISAVKNMPGRAFYKLHFALYYLFIYLFFQLGVVRGKQK